VRHRFALGNGALLVRVEELLLESPNFTKQVHHATVRGLEFDSAAIQSAGHALDHFVQLRLLARGKLSLPTGHAALRRTTGLSQALARDLDSDGLGQRVTLHSDVLRQGHSCFLSRCLLDEALVH
jgi:hypothetical protein